ncbi:MAG: hypothetical protein AAF913_00055 [Pseudomonadota bacterium]
MDKQEKKSGRGGWAKWLVAAVLVPIFVALVPIFGPDVRDYFFRIDDSVISLREGYDFIARAREADWSNGNVELDYPGDGGDRRGYVYSLSAGGPKLENGDAHDRLLFTHPEWVPYGIIRGTYGPFRVDSDLFISAEVGYLAPNSGGFLQSDGIEFQVIFRPQGGTDEVLASVTERSDGETSILLAELGSFAGVIGTVTLQVRAGQTANQDWAAWSHVRVVRQ